MSLRDNKIRAVIRSDSEVVVGLGTRAPQLVDGLTRREVRALAAAGPLSTVEWSRLRTSKPPSDRWPQVVTIVAEAVASINPAPARLPLVAVTGDAATLAHVGVAVAPLADQVIADCAAVGRLESALLLAHAESGRERGPRQPSTHRGDEPLISPDLIVLLGHEVMPVSHASGWHRLNVRHLPVVVTGDGCSIGPLVTAPDDPCSLCVELHRADHDSQWARMTAQFDGPLPPASYASADVQALVAGLTATVVRGVATGEALTPGTVVTARAGSPMTQAHRWGRHRHCRRHVRIGIG